MTYNQVILKYNFENTVHISELDRWLKTNCTKEYCFVYCLAHTSIELESSVEIYFRLKWSEIIKCH